MSFEVADEESGELTEEETTEIISKLHGVVSGLSVPSGFLMVLLAASMIADRGSRRKNLSEWQ